MPSASATSSGVMPSRKRRTRTTRWSIDKVPEASLQLVTVGDDADRHRLPVGSSAGERSLAGRPLRLPLGLGVADPNEQAIGPALVLGRVTQAADVTPDVEERLLGRILGQAAGHSGRRGPPGTAGDSRRSPAPRRHAGRLAEPEPRGLGPCPHIPWTDVRSAAGGTESVPVLYRVRAATKRQIGRIRRRRCVWFAANHLRNERPRT